MCVCVCVCGGVCVCGCECAYKKVDNKDKDTLGENE